MYVAPFASLPPLSDKRSRAWADASLSKKKAGSHACGMNLHRSISITTIMAIEYNRIASIAHGSS